MSWFILIMAGLFEVAWAIGLKYTEGFTRLWPTIGNMISMVASIWLLEIAIRKLPLGTAYAIWTGIGISGTFILSIFLFEEACTLGRLICIGFILAGILGLKLTTL
jgi:quaternary ammonium compound-resistance protein SugE